MSKIIKMVIEELKSLRKIKRLTPEAEKLLKGKGKITRPHYFIDIDDEIYELGKLNLYSNEFLFQTGYDVETNHIKGENIITGWEWR